MRQPLDLQHDPRPGVSISTFAREYPLDFQVPAHVHRSDQLIYATSGVMEVSAGPHSWLIPPQFAVWVPARTNHRIRMAGTVAMRTLYLRRGLVDLPKVCAVLPVPPLLRELIVEAVQVGQLSTRKHLHRALRDLIVSRLQSSSHVPTLLTLPTEPRALAVARAFMADLAEPTPLSATCKTLGVTVRTIQRSFRRELGMSFEAWRMQARLMKGIELLVRGYPVKEVAFRVGYLQPSAFVEMFRRTLGATPKAWVRALNAGGRS